jgi:hypothetical protein
MVNMSKKANNISKKTIIRKARDSENPYALIAKSLEGILEQLEIIQRRPW